MNLLQMGELGAVIFHQVVETVADTPNYNLLEKR